MDDKAFIAAFAAKEAQRINEKLKEMINSPEPPSEEKKDAVIQDIDATLKRLQNALLNILATSSEEDKEKERHVRPS